jgi:hypothetical protein
VPKNALLFKAQTDSMKFKIKNKITKTKDSVFEWIPPLAFRPSGRFGCNTLRQPNNGQNLRPAIASM